MRRSCRGWVVLLVLAGCGEGEAGDVGDLRSLVCGVDGQTYTVEEASDDARDVAYRGRCDDPMSCSAVSDCFAGDDCARDVCIPVPTGCPCVGVFEPVCGKDGRSYLNACEAECADVAVSRRGLCEADPCAVIDCRPGYTCEAGECVPVEPCVCPTIYAPVCGSDGNSYSNACAAECAGVEVVEEGVCDDCLDDADCEPDELCIDWPEGEPSQCVWIGCDSDAHCRPGERCVIDDICQAPPVVGPCDAAFPRWYYDRHLRRCEQFIWGGCGGNENNFQSPEACEAACGAGTGPVEKLSLAPRAGRCEPDVQCVDIYLPVCGIDGVTYGNGCEAERSGVEIAYDGECIPEVTCQHQGCPEGFTCDYCQLSSGPRWICLSPLAGACAAPAAP